MQETINFELPVSKKPVVIRGYMTGYVDQEVRRVSANANKTSYEVSPEQVRKAQATGEEPTPTVHVASDPGVSIDADNKRLELMVVSIEGVTTDILKNVLSLPKQDVAFILEKIKSVEGESKVEGAGPKAQQG